MTGGLGHVFEVNKTIQTCYGLLLGIGPGVVITDWYSQLGVPPPDIRLYRPTVIQRSIRTVPTSGFKHQPMANVLHCGLSLAILG